MTIAGWIFFAFAAVFIGMCGFAISMDFGKKGGVVVGVVTIAIIVGLLIGMMWYYDNTASGQRAMIDQKSNLSNGLNRTVKVYTANGDVIAEYSGLIDIEANDGGYIKFDFGGKRYMYYNCFVESVAEIGN